jgi:hypothetical protein
MPARKPTTAYPRPAKTPGLVRIRDFLDGIADVDDDVCIAVSAASLISHPARLSGAGKYTCA